MKYDNSSIWQQINRVLVTDRRSWVVSESYTLLSQTKVSSESAGNLVTKKNVSVNQKVFILSNFILIYLRKCILSDYKSYLSQQ